MKHAGLPFDCVLSAEPARAYKPDAVVYQTAAALGPGQEADRAEDVTCDLYATDFTDLATQLGCP